MADEGSDEQDINEAAEAWLEAGRLLYPPPVDPKRGFPAKPSPLDLMFSIAGLADATPTERKQAVLSVVPYLDPAAQRALGRVFSPASAPDQEAAFLAKIEGSPKAQENNS